MIEAADYPSGETPTATARSCTSTTVLPVEYSSKVQQRPRCSAVPSVVRPHSARLNDIERALCRNFASKGLGVRVPLAPPLVRVGLPLLGGCAFRSVQQKVEQSRPLVSFYSCGPATGSRPFSICTTSIAVISLERPVGGLPNVGNAKGVGFLRGFWCHGLVGCPVSMFR